MCTHTRVGGNALTLHKQLQHLRVAQGLQQLRILYVLGLAKQVF